MYISAVELNLTVFVVFIKIKLRVRGEKKLNRTVVFVEFVNKLKSLQCMLKYCSLKILSFKVAVALFVCI